MRFLKFLLEISRVDVLQKYIDTKLEKHLLDKKKKLWYNNKMQKKEYLWTFQKLVKKLTQIVKN